MLARFGPWFLVILYLRYSEQKEPLMLSLPRQWIATVLCGVFFIAQVSGFCSLNWSCSSQWHQMYLHFKEGSLFYCQSPLFNPWSAAINSGLPFNPPSTGVDEGSEEMSLVDAEASPVQAQGTSARKALTLSAHVHLPNRHFLSTPSEPVKAKCSSSEIVTFKVVKCHIGNVTAGVCFLPSAGVSPWTLGSHGRSCPFRGVTSHFHSVGSFDMCHQAEYRADAVCAADP